MGLLSDTLRHLLASDPAERRAGLAGLVGRQFGAAPVRLGHDRIAELRGPAAGGGEPAPPGFDVFHFPKSGGGLTPRTVAVTLTLGLSEPQGRELMALTLADSREPGQDRFAWMLAAVAAADPARGQVVALPPGCLGRSSHASVVLADPGVFAGGRHAGLAVGAMARAVPDYERAIGARLDLCVPVTPREADWIAAHGADAFFAAMGDQGIAPLADRPAGETRLP